MALAIDTRCFCPPESVIPRSPKMVSYPLLKPTILSCTTAFLAASITSLSEAFNAPKLILFLILSENKKAS